MRVPSIPSFLPMQPFHLLLLAALVSAPVAARDISLPNGPYISTSADAEVERAPDFAVLNLSGRLIEATPEAARARIDELLERILDALAEFEAAIDSQRLEAIAFGEHREYDPERQRAVPAGFFGSFALEVRVADFERLNALQYRLAEFELESLRGPQFELTEVNRAELEERARIESVREATRRAEELAAAQGVALGPIWGILHEPMHRIAGGDPGPSVDSSSTVVRQYRSEPARETFALGFDPQPIRVRARSGVVYELVSASGSDRP